MDRTYFNIGLGLESAAALHCHQTHRVRCGAGPRRDSEEAEGEAVVYAGGQGPWGLKIDGKFLTFPQTEKIVLTHQYGELTIHSGSFVLPQLSWVRILEFQRLLTLCPSGSASGKWVELQLGKRLFSKWVEEGKRGIC